MLSACFCKQPSKLLEQGHHFLKRSCVAATVILTMTQALVKSHTHSLHRRARISVIQAGGVPCPGTELSGLR